jgi:hypothetical protein
MKFSEQSTHGLPPICGDEGAIAEAMADPAPVFLSASGIDFGRINSAYAIALHMHQPLIPAGTADLSTAPIISNLKFMMDHPEIPDAHNAVVFRWCYQRMAEFIPQLVKDGKEPRVMLDYSGCLLHGLADMGAQDVLAALKPLATEAKYQRCVEWLGTTWGHAVAPSTPPADFRLHVRAWQHHFAHLFGLEALRRVRGFSPAEMALPNHPEVAYEFVRTLKACGYRWVLLQEHSVEKENGAAINQPHLPHRLVARNARGERASITALIKTRGSDNKLVAQMQPYFEAKDLKRAALGGVSVPQLVTQIGDGENGGVIMNEFPPMFLRTIHDTSHTATPPMNAGEYLEHLAAAGVRDEDFPVIQPIFQSRIWERYQPGGGAAELEQVIAALRKADPAFHVEGGSWTSDISWVKGYDNVLGPMEQASALFAEKAAQLASDDPRYRAALFHLLCSQTSCFRYWGQGQWTEYGRELCRRTMAMLREGSRR